MRFKRTKRWVKLKLTPHEAVELFDMATSAAISLSESGDEPEVMMRSKSLADSYSQISQELHQSKK